MPNETVSDAVMEGFADAWRQADAVPGWLTREQAEVLWRCTRGLRRGATVVEIGSHQGRSTVVLGLAARSVGATVVAVDPFVAGRLFGGVQTRERFESAVSAAGLGEIVRLAPEYSTTLRRRWRAPVDLLYVDGKHDLWTCRDDLRWRSFMPSRAAVLVHDGFSSVGVTAAILLDVVIAGRLHYREREGSLVVLETRPGHASAGRLAAVGQLPWFVRNLGFKLLLRLRLRSLSARLGHAGPHDPY